MLLLRVHSTSSDTFALCWEPFAALSLDQGIEQTKGSHADHFERSSDCKNRQEQLPRNPQRLLAFVRKKDVPLWFDVQGCASAAK